MSYSLKLLAITSLPTIGNAGLKNMMQIMGSDMIPIPTTVACGLGNMEGHTKVSVSLEETLEHTMTIARTYGFRLVVYVGYLVDSSQLEMIRRYILAHKDMIETIIIDPVCGDNGRAYVPESIISSFPLLLDIADYVIPNETELRLMSSGDFVSELGTLIDVFRESYVDTQIIVTSVQKDNKTYNVHGDTDSLHYYPFTELTPSFSGTGDLFAALFIKYRFFQRQSVRASIESSTSDISKMLSWNIYMGMSSHDLKVVTIPKKKRGVLYYVIGPSGVGKDTLLDVAKKNMADMPVVFVRRFITRPSDAGGESHIAISKEDFLIREGEGFFSLWWESHGNYYGVPSSIDLVLDHGYNVVLNGSRGYYEEALQRYPDMCTILISAEKETIRKRLLARGRESADEIENRLIRSEQFLTTFKEKDVHMLSNDGSLDESGAAFIELLLRY